MERQLSNHAFSIPFLQANWQSTYPTLFDEPEKYGEDPGEGGLIGEPGKPVAIGIDEAIYQAYPREIADNLENQAYSVPRVHMPSGTQYSTSKMAMIPIPGL